jgi:hypothetical protein
MTIRIAVAALVLILSAAGTARAQECRDPSPAERAALLKAANALEATIAKPLLDAGWQAVRQKTALTDGIFIATHPSPPRPIFDCAALFDVQFQASPSSPNGIAAQNAIQSLSQNFSQSNVQRVTAIRASAAISVRASENSPQPLVPYATSVQSDDGTVTTTRCYGRYPFRHPPGSPYVENLCVSLITSPSVTKELDRTIDWSALRAALTP